MYEITITGTQNFMGKQIPIVNGGFGEGNKCMSDKTIAKIHEMRETDIRRRIFDNINRFHNNIDFIDLKKGVHLTHTLELLRNLGYAKQSITQAEHIYILSERGYSKLIKIMDTDLAWEIHDNLMDEYFEMREIIANNNYITRTEFMSFLNEFKETQNTLFCKMLDMQQTFIGSFNSSMQNFTGIVLNQVLSSPLSPTLSDNKIKEVNNISSNLDAREYRNEIFDLCKKICKLSTKFEEPKYLLSYCYKEITKKYGIVWDQERKDYYDENGYYPKSLITMISEFGDNRHYKSILKAMLQDIYSSLKDEQNSLELDKSYKLASTWGEAKALVCELARCTNDNSPNNALTYNRVYKMLDNINWTYYRLKYKKAHNITARTINPSKKEIIGDNPRLQVLFTDAVNNKFQEVNLCIH